jgi:hypothetical protein
MAALNARQVAAGVVGVAIMFGVCSCTPQTPNTPGGTVPVSTATVSPTDGPTPDVSVTFDASVPAYDAGVPAWWPTDQAAPTTGAWSEGYQFSEQPQTAAEQAIYDQFPAAWASGVRDMTTGDAVQSSVIGEEQIYNPGPLVQYVDGVRYEGTPSLPLVFGDRDPMQPPMEAFNAMADFYRSGDPNVGYPILKTKWYGQGLYSVMPERDYFSNGKTVILVGGSGPDSPVPLDDVACPSNTKEPWLCQLPTFDSLEEAVAYVLSGADIHPSPLSVPANEMRNLYPGEYMIGTSNPGGKSGIVNPVTGEIVLITF